MTPPQMHLALNHLPIVGVPFLAAALAAGVWWRSKALVRFALWGLLAIGLVTIPVYLSGLQSEEPVEELAGVQRESIHRHEDTGKLALIAVEALAVLALASLLVSRRRPVATPMSALMLAAAIAVGALLAWTAHEGGLIRHPEIRGGAASPSEDGEGEEGHRR